MDKRMVEFIRALRAAGVRISVAESQDALHGIHRVGLDNLDHFRNTLSATLVKEHRDQPTFEYFFPLFFSANQPNLDDILDELTQAQQDMLQQALDALMGDEDALRELIDQLLDGQPFDEQTLQNMAKQAGLPNGDEMYQRGWFERRMMRQSGLSQIDRMIQRLLDQLRAMGMDDEALDALEQMLRDNARGLSDQVSQFVGTTLAQQMAHKPREEQPDLIDIPIQRLGAHDLEAIRDEVRKLAARLKTRAALRQKRAKSGQFDPRRTLRANMRYGGTPVEMRFRKRHKKPNLVLICDLSTSMRYMVEFLMTLVYELHDQVQRTNSFVFIDDMKDVSMELNEADSRTAVEKILLDNPPGYYSTDLGNSLNTFNKHHMHTIDQRTTVIILGDGRNNYNNPRLDIHQTMQRKARRLYWFCPERHSQWGTGDSDMPLYAQQADGVHIIRSLRDLANAVDQILITS